jgi:hypothetical protein
LPPDQDMSGVRGQGSGVSIFNLISASMLSTNATLAINWL